MDFTFASQPGPIVIDYNFAEHSSPYRNNADFYLKSI